MIGDLNQIGPDNHVWAYMKKVTPISYGDTTCREEYGKTVPDRPTCRVIINYTPSKCRPTIEMILMGNSSIILKYSNTWASIDSRSSRCAVENRAAQVSIDKASIYLSISHVATQLIYE